MSALRRSEEDVIHLGSGDDLRAYLDTLSGHGPQHEAVIEVDGDDDLTSVRSKLESVRVPRAVLVIPASAKVIRDGVEFRVLRRLQRELGLEIVVVSNDLTRRAMAAENGFRNVFGSLRSYYRSKPREPDRAESVPFADPEEFSPAISVSRWGIAVGMLLAILFAALAYLAVPMVTVAVYPETQTLVRDVEVLIEIGGPRLDATAQRLSGRLVQERVQVDDTIGIKDVPPPPPPPLPSGGAQPPGLQPGSVTLSVRDALRSRMLERATAQGMERLRSQLKSNESMPEASIRTEVIAERYDRNIGDMAETLSGSLEVVTTGLAFSNDDFRKLVRALWSQDIPRDYLSVGEPSLSDPEVVSAEGRHMTLRVRASGTLQRAVNVDAIASAARGSALAEAQQRVAETGEFVRPPEITLWPDWASRAYRVHVEVMLEHPPEPR